MSKLNCIVLEYAQSDLDQSGTPFLVIVLDELESSQQVKLYVLENWELLIPPEGQSDAIRIADFIFDVRQQQFKESQAITVFFRSVQQLNMGPIRTSYIGSLERFEAEASWPDIIADRRDMLLCTSDVFNSVLSLAYKTSDPQALYPLTEPHL